LARALWLALALALSLPSFHSGWTVLTSACFLAEFLSGGRWRPLTIIASEVSSRRLPASADGRAIPADLYTAARFTRAPGLVLVHGLSPRGKDDSRVIDAAVLLARSGWAVAVPTVEGLTALRLRPEDATAVVAGIHALAEARYQPVAVLAVSVGAGPALLAAADPRVAGSVSAVLALGGYASAVELLRYTLTGAYRFDTASGRRPIDERAVEQFARANPELVDPAGRRLVDNRDPQAVDALVAELPPATRRLLAELSPQAAIGRIRAPLFLVHGRDDPAVPFTESRRLARAARSAGRPVRMVIVGSMAHVEPGERAGLRDLALLWASFYAFSVTSRAVTWVGGRS